MGTGSMPQRPSHRSPKTRIVLRLDASSSTSRMVVITRSLPSGLLAPLQTVGSKLR
jgi:hypothetical protein